MHYRTIIITAILLTGTMHSSRFESGRNGLSTADKQLINAVESGDIMGVRPALTNGANPNAAYAGATIFLRAFDNALDIDLKTNQVRSIETAYADIAYILASNGGDIDALIGHIRAYRFASELAQRMFNGFVSELKRNAMPL